MDRSGAVVSLVAVNLDKETCVLATEAHALAASEDPEDRARSVRLAVRIAELLATALELRHRSERRMLAAGRMTRQSVTLRAAGGTVTEPKFERALTALGE